MMIRIVLAILSASVIVMSVDYHVTADDKLDFVNMSSSELKTFVYCYIDKGPCTEVSNSYKEHYPIVLREMCGRCTPCHKYQLQVFFRRLRDDLPEEDKEQRAKFDPDNTLYERLYQSVVSDTDPSVC